MKTLHKLQAGIRVSVIAAAILGSISSAQALTAAVDPDTGSVVPGYEASIPVSVPVKASITVNCSFDPDALPAGNRNVGELNSAFDWKIDFNMRCPTPLNVAVVSSHGGMVASDLGSPAGWPSGYTGLRDYNVKLFLQGNTKSSNATCAASTLVASTGPCAFRGPAANVSGGGTGAGLYLNDTALNGDSYVSGSYIELSASAYGGSPMLMASGSYADTLTVSLAAVY